jgi:predicted branched-subunit amino acid permease
MDIDRRIAAKVGALLPAVGLYGLAFGATSQQAGLPLSQTIGLSLLVFGGGSQFGAVGVIASGGSGASAAITGLLINARMLAFGVAMAPILPRSWRVRLGASQFIIDETVALATAETDVISARRAFWYTAASLWVVWNLSAIAGATVLSSIGDPSKIGLDAAIPAAFLGLVAPRLRSRPGLMAGLIGAAIALVLIPLTPAGVPVMMSSLGAIVVLGATMVKARRNEVDS